MALADNKTMAELANVCARELQGLEAACTPGCVLPAGEPAGARKLANYHAGYPTHFWEKLRGGIADEDVRSEEKSKRGTSL